MKQSPPRAPALLLVTHGRLADELLESARRLEGDLPDTEAVSLGWDSDVSSSSRRVEEAVARLKDRYGAVVILTDLFGGAAADLSLSFHEPGTVEVATGANLAMVTKFRDVRLHDAREVVRRIADQGRASIQVASDLLRKPGAEGGSGSG